MSNTISKKILNYIYAHEEGWVFTSKDLLKLGSEETIHVTLHRLKERGVIKRIIHGIYYYPKMSELLGLIPPDIRGVANALASKHQIGKMELIFKKTTPKNMAMAGKISGLVVQALKFMGRDHIDQRKIRILRKKLTNEDLKILKEDENLAPVWIRKIIQSEIMEGLSG